MPSSLKDIYKQAPIRDKNWIFPFGKYKGLTLEAVMDDDPNYISFLQAKDICDFHSDIFTSIEEMRQIARDGYVPHEMDAHKF